MSTYTAKPADIKSDWLVVDANGLTIGRLATQIASVLRGKHKTIYSPHLDVGDYVIVVNAEKIRSTGKKEKTKVYYSHSGYPGGIKDITLEKLRIKKPENIIEFAVKRMLPKGPLGRKMFGKLWVYAGPDHPHSAQQPKEFPLVN